MEEKHEKTPLTSAGILPLLPPYPIVLVSTKTNIITINQIHYFTLNPLRIGIAVAPSRYTFDLLVKEREFVVNVPTAENLEAVKTCGRISGRKGDKFAAAGLTKVKSSAVSASSIGECSARIECKVEKIIGFKERSWFIGLVVAANTCEGHDGTKALLCGRTDYLLPGESISER
ncbi:MAG TPA: hypothetical protein DCZ94_22595 [Lentisphaeria bacterium]|nr:MAG: hypothetical protein A2X48_13840 [Lentisphaerae bacterium GWF2_49_21]HBC89738.1 hypothetical protein [Lentisphaeria bacterium]